jgi:pyruvate/2-oxoglutarate/acetoin dehydrogenase E1 component/TPP-dependent pyruvate/acetoin dehydrogenase alpha subunit
MPKNSMINKVVESISQDGVTITRKEALNDLELCYISREASLIGRKEVLGGKAKFGILGDGKETPQVALAKAFQKGDFRSGYYRDQTLMFALGVATVEDFFAQIYADADNDPFSGGRQMNNHYATKLVDGDTGEWTRHTDLYNVSAGISSTGGQMSRALGLAFSSKKYRESKALQQDTGFSDHGREVCFCTIGDASTSEGVFWESINAAGVLQVPLAVFVWDDGYGISVPIDYQTTKGSISEILDGFRYDDEKGQGFDIYTVKGWDYPAMVAQFSKAIERMRDTHIPALFHVQELTQPQGHSTSGSHERYKNKERLDWERDHDCILKMEQWIIDSGLATEEECLDIKTRAKKYAADCRQRAWKAYMDPVEIQRLTLAAIMQQVPDTDGSVAQAIQTLGQLINPPLSELLQAARRLYYSQLAQPSASLSNLKDWIQQTEQTGYHRYHTHLYSHSPKSALKVPHTPAIYSDNSPTLNGFEILNHCFDAAFEKNPAVFAFGEDVGYIGDVNQGFAGLQKKYGEHRVFDTGIREWTIVGQALGMAMRGLRPIAEIQYLDYLIYGLAPLSDDLATVRFRSDGIQQAPAIIRSRGHRLEGIWHAGSPLGMIINALRGIYVLVPRNMTQAAGFYNTMLQSDDPALIIECLNGYRLKEKLPDNFDTFTVPLGVPEILQEGSDLTLVTYGSCVRIAQTGIALLEKYGISVELIDVQSLIPFDIHHSIVESLKKTNRIVFLDEDVPGGASAFMMQQVLEIQGGYQYLDSNPLTITAKDHRTPYGTDGDYFTKPNPEDIFEAIYALMLEAEPARFKGPL